MPKRLYSKERKSIKQELTDGITSVTGARKRPSFYIPGFALSLVAAAYGKSAKLWKIKSNFSREQTPFFIHFLINTQQKSIILADKISDCCDDFFRRKRSKPWEIQAPKVHDAGSGRRAFSCGDPADAEELPPLQAKQMSVTKK